MFQAGAWLVAQYYSLVHSYAGAIALVALTIMVVLTPLTLKSTKGMLEMQRLQPEMRRLQQQYRSDRQRLNEEMMKLYQEHKVNPLSSCLPLVAQMPVFIIMFRVLHGLTKVGSDGRFTPGYISKTSDLYTSLVGKKQMLSLGLDLAERPAVMMSNNFAKGIPYALLVVALAGLYFVQQRMIASRTVSPTMSQTQAKVMQYLPVAFAIFQVFLPTGLIVYYATQAIIRIGQQWYITRRFYGHDNSIGRQAQAASAAAREMSKNDKGDKSKPSAKKDDVAKDTPSPIVSRRVTPSKNKPAPSGNRPSRPVPPSKRPQPPKK